MSKTTCYLQVEPEFARRASWENARVQAISVKRVTQKRPESPIPGSVVVKIDIEIPDAAFLPLEPEATIIIPVEHTSPVAVESTPIERLPEAEEER